MVREDTVAQIKGAFDDFRSGNIASLLGRLTDDVEWDVPGEGTIIPFGGKVKGKAAVAEFLQKVGATCDFSQFDQHEFATTGDTVMVLGEWTAVIRANGAKTTDVYAMAFWFRGDKVSKYRQYSDTRPLIEALSAKPSNGGR
jgi:ketosteroid isomerase-like protein